MKSLDCGNSKYKCVFKKQLQKLAEDQATGKPGHLGPVSAFHGEEFFSQFSHRQLSIRNILEGPGKLSGFTTIITFGDIHGDLISLLGVLRAAGVISDDAHWLPSVDPTAGKRCVVQLGDLLDRGGRGSATVDTSHSPREEINIIEYLFALDKQAKKVGERVLSLSGNHEEMALRSAFDAKLAAKWVFTTKPTACPFPDKKRSREDVFATAGALRYFALCRPLMASSSLGWIFAHGDVPIHPLRRFVEESHVKLLTFIREQTDLSQGEAIVGAVNLLWAAYVLELGGDKSLTDMLREVLPDKEKRRGYPPGYLSPFPMSVATCRTLAQMGSVDGDTCDCKSQVDTVGKIFGFDWAVMGGIALGHTVNASISSKCAGKVQLLDVGMSEAFRGFNKTGKIAFLNIQVTQYLSPQEHES